LISPLVGIGQQAEARIVCSCWKKYFGKIRQLLGLCSITAGISWIMEQTSRREIVGDIAIMRWEEVLHETHCIDWLRAVAGDDRIRFRQAGDRAACRAR
jgi:hypothetical protein